MIFTEERKDGETLKTDHKDFVVGRRIALCGQPTDRLLPVPSPSNQGMPRRLVRSVTKPEAVKHSVHAVFDTKTHTFKVSVEEQTSL